MKMKFKSFFVVMLMVCALFMLSACGEEKTSNNTTVTETITTAIEESTVAEESTVVEETSIVEESSIVDDNTVVEESSNEEQMRTITDLEGNVIEIPMEVKEVVNSWPASNSVMLLAGAGELLCATHSATATNAWSQLIYPDIVNLPTNVTNVEDVLKYDCDLYITSNADTAASMREVGIPAISLKFTNYETMKQALSLLGECLGGEYEQKLLAWCDYVDNWTQTITERLKDIPEEERPVLYHIAAQHNAEVTTTFALPCICGEWADICGTIYLSELISDPSAGTLSLEEILNVDPDIIIVGGIQQAEAWENLQSNEVLADTTAMKEGKAYIAPMGMFSWCREGMESALMLPWLAATIYPDYFPEIDIREETYNFYKDFAGVELTDAQIENMLMGYAPDDEYGATVIAD